VLRIEWYARWSGAAASAHTTATFVPLVAARMLVTAGTTSVRRTGEPSVGAGQKHVLDWQVRPPVHAFPHEEQCRESDRVSTHRPSQCVSAAEPQTQRLATHDASSAQAASHAPQ
jgi:hypothetical protein